MKQLNLFMAFLRVGLLGYGGGPAAIPLIQKEVVERYGWIEEEEFSDILAIGNTLPGPIATKMAGYIGYRISGVIGMMNALVASVVPTVMLLIFLLFSLASFREYAWVQGMTRGVLPVVAVMLGVLTWGFIQKSTADYGWLRAMLLVILSVIVVQLLGVHPAILIMALILYVFIKPEKRKDCERAGEPS
ncbi:chromate transporter [Salipaludibacillus sp. LMS25]|jgi:chromate transporter|uniref:chromate transporter n=1 Tax=Salipaludibacillus sp. LMS25 TaxID=2924031 RepID=UPI0020CFF824|nr:chromate transporter [Salipaludibacillus sp. LMS25]UTR14069.1 chromate transporter [Salipaludibacillus sp. LMS25]